MENFQIVIFGHKLGTHTHSYIHYGFHKAFKHLGYKTFWESTVKDLIEAGWNKTYPTLFITEGKVDNEIPFSDYYYYVCYNCKGYGENKINIQSTCDIEITPDRLSLIQGDCLYILWATHLLPNEINSEIENLKKNFENRSKSNSVYFIGTIGDNKKELKKYGHNIKLLSNIKFEEEKKYLNSSLINPTIVGKWQKKNNYIPCIAFKTVSYGNLLITNSKAVKKLFPNCVYSDDESQLFDLSLKAIQDKECLNKIIEEMENVRDNHTYINRVNTILSSIKYNFPKVGVIFFHKNNKKYKQEWINKCIKSIRDQTYKNYTIYEICYSENEERLIEDSIFFHQSFENHSFAQNFIIDKCFDDGCEIVFNTNIDDYYSPVRFERQLYSIIEEKFELISSNYIYINSNEKIDSITSFHNLDIEREFIKEHNIIANPCICYTKKMWKECGGYPNTVPHEDFDLWKLCLKKGIRIKILEEPLLFYRIHDNQITAAGRVDKYKYISTWWEKNMSCDKKYTIASQWWDTSSRQFLVENITKTKNVLDIGCGNGKFGLMLMEKDIIYKGIDNCSHLVEKCINKNLDVIKCNAECIPEKDNSYEIVTCRHVLEHQETFKKILDEAIRIASKEVWIIFFIKPGKEEKIVYDKKEDLYHNRYSIRDIKDYLYNNKKVSNYIFSYPFKKEACLKIITYNKIIITSCIYYLKSKYDFSKYLKWIENIFKKFSREKLIIFTNSETYNKIKHLSNKRISFIIKEIEELTYYTYKKFWEQNQLKNSTLLNYDWKLAMLWCEKINMVKEIKDKYNPEYCVWMDIGYWRDNLKLFDKWLYLDRVKNNKVYYNMIEDLEIVKNFYEDNNYIPETQISIAGGFFISHTDIFNVYSDLFDFKLKQYIREGRFIKDDQMLIAEIAIENPNIFRFVKGENDWFIFKKFLSPKSTKFSIIDFCDNKKILVSGASQNHFNSLLQLIKSYEINCKRILFIVYDLGLNEESVLKLRDIKCISYRRFDFSKYPSFVNIENNKGAYAWKPIIIHEVYQEYGKNVIWMDAGNVIRDNLNLLYKECGKGIHTSVSQGYIKDWTHPQTLQIMNFNENLENLENRNAACVGFGKNMHSFIREWKDYALDEECISPKGSSFNNHMYDQSILTILYYKYFFQSDNNKIGYDIHMYID